MTNPLVSIIICSHNRAQLLKETLDSVFAQIHAPVEIIVVDDGSTDNTSELMKSFANRIRYYWQKNQGISVARNTGLRLAKGEFIAFQDDDDLMIPNRIPLLLRGIKQYPEAVLSIGDWHEIDANGNLTDRKSDFMLRFKTRIKNDLLIRDGYKAILWPKITPTPHTTLFRKMDADRIGNFDTIFFHSCEDADFFARLAKLGPIVYVPEVVSYYRRGHDSLINNNILSIISKLVLFEKHLSMLKNQCNDLRHQLQMRTLKKLKQLATLQSKGRAVSNSIDFDLNKFLRFLRLRDKIAYKWLVSVKLPLRKKIMRYKIIRSILELKPER